MIVCIVHYKLSNVMNDINIPNSDEYWKQPIQEIYKRIDRCCIGCGDECVLLALKTNKQRRHREGHESVPHCIQERVWR